MKRNTANFILNLLAFFVLWAMVLTGYLIKFVLPPRMGYRGLSLAGWDRHQWGELHFILSLIFLILMILHLILHWKWICGTVVFWVKHSSMLSRRMRWIAAIVALLLILGSSVLLIKIAKSRVQSNPSPGWRHQEK